MHSSGFCPLETSCSQFSPYAVNLWMKPNDSELPSIYAYAKHKEEIKALRHTIYMAKQQSRYSEASGETLKNSLSNMKAITNNFSWSSVPISLDDYPTEGLILLHTMTTGINYLLSADPSLSGVLARFQNIVLGISHIQPNISADDINILKNMTKNIIDVLPDSTSIYHISTFLKIVLEGFNVDHQLYLNNIAEATVALTQAKEQQSAFDKASSVIRELIQNLTRLSDSAPDGSVTTLFSLGNIIAQDVVSLVNLFPSLSNNQRSSISNFLITLLSNTWGNFSNGGDTMGLGVVMFLAKDAIGDILLESPGASIDEIHNYTSNYLSSVLLRLDSTFNAYIDTLFDRYGRAPWHTGLAGSQLFDIEGFLNDIIHIVTVHASHGQSFTTPNLKDTLYHWNNSTYPPLHNDIDNYVRSLEQNEASTKTALEDLSSLINNIQNFLITLAPLGDAFESMVLNDFSPAQATLFQPMVTSMQTNRYGANFINNVLTSISSFDTASGYYQLQNALVQSVSTDAYSGSIANILVSISSEMDKARNDVYQIKKAREFLKFTKDTIFSNNELSVADKITFYNLANSYENSLSVIQRQVQDVYSVLAALKIAPPLEPPPNALTPPTPDPDPDAPPTPDVPNNVTFTIRGPSQWYNLLTHLEAEAINGIPSAAIPGGLSSFSTSVLAQSQSYSSQQQSLMITLQQNMTTVQQQWSIISSSIQTLEHLMSTLISSVL